MADRDSLQQYFYLAILPSHGITLSQTNRLAVCEAVLCQRRAANISGGGIGAPQHIKGDSVLAGLSKPLLDVGGGLSRHPVPASVTL